MFFIFTLCKTFLRMKKELQKLRSLIVKVKQILWFIGQEVQAKQICAIA